MSALLVECPAEWLELSPVRFVNEPFSDAAIGEANKTYIDLGPIDMEACGADDGERIKFSGESQLRGDLEMSEEMSRAHNVILQASRAILSDEQYLASACEFTHRIGKGAQINDRPHLDGSYTRPRIEKLKLVGMACTSPTTLLLNGPITPNQLERDGRLISVRNLYKRFRPEPLPEGRIILLGPAMLHMPRMGERQFMRWQVKI